MLLFLPGRNHRSHFWKEYGSLTSIKERMLELITYTGKRFHHGASRNKHSLFPDSYHSNQIPTRDSMADQLIAALLALLSALVVATGTVIRHLVAEETPPSDTKSAALSTLTSLKWWSGAGVSIVGYSLQAAALRFASIILVQPITILSLFFAMPLSAKVTGRKVSAKEWFWAVILTLSVAILLVVGRPTNDHASAHPAMWVGSLLIGLIVVLILIRLARKGLRKERALLLGTASGFTYGYMSFLTKSGVMELSHGGLYALVTGSSLYLIIATAIAATWLQQAAFNAGAIQQSLPAMTVASPLTSSLLGVIVFQERFTTPEHLIWVPIIAAITAAVSVVLLSRAEAEETV